jgi:AraC family transcriptional regulator
VLPLSLAPGSYFGRCDRTRRAGTLVLRRTVYGALEEVPAHAHAEAYLCLVLAGAFRERSRRGELEVRAGAAVLHPSGETHEDRFGERPAACLNVALAPGWCELGPVEALHAPSGGVGPLVWKLAREFDEEDDASELSIEGLTLELLAALLRAGRERGPEPAWLARVAERLEREPRGRLSLSGLAWEAGVHPSTLARTFRRFRGCSLGEFRRRARLARACELLRTSAVPLAEVAVRAGFADQSHMTRAVRAELAVTPAMLRGG